VSSFEFRMWGIRKRDRQKPYQVRWLVAGRSHAETFVTRALAESFRAELIAAARAGEAFDEVTGLPEAGRGMCRGSTTPCLTWIPSGRARRRSPASPSRKR
jgi:hypothetical protein